MARTVSSQRYLERATPSPPLRSAPGCKQTLPQGTVTYFVSNEHVQEEVGSALTWLLGRHPNTDLAKATADAVEALCGQLRVHVGDATQQCRSLKALCTLFQEYPDSPMHVADAPTLVGLLKAAVRRHATDATVQELACSALAPLAAASAELLANDIALFVDALSRHPEHSGVQQAACQVLAGILQAVIDGAAPAAQAAKRGASALLVRALRKYSDSEVVAVAVTSALAPLLVNHPRSCANAVESDAVSVLCSVLTLYQKTAAVQANACKALAEILYRQPQSAAQASRLEAEQIYLQAFRNHADNAEVQAAAGNSVAWMVVGHTNSAESVALAGIPDAMMDGLERHWRIRPVQQAVCHVLGRLFDVNNAVFPVAVRIRSLAVILELLRREPASADTQLYASLALGNLCAHNTQSAQDAASAGALELLLQALRCHPHNHRLRGYALLAMARIIENAPACTARAATAGATPRFDEALQDFLLDDSGLGHVAAALAQIYTDALAVQAEPKSVLEAFAQLLHRHPKSGAGAARTGAAKVLPAILHRCPSDPDIQAMASCALGRLLSAQPTYAKVAMDSHAVHLLLLAMRTHPTERAVQAQAVLALVSMIQACSASAEAIADQGGVEVLSEALRLHPEAADVKLHVNTVQRMLGRLVPALTPFPFVPAPPPEEEVTY